MTVTRDGWQSYSYLEGDKRKAFSKLIKSPRFAFLLALTFGFMGAHRLYLGHYRMGVAIAIFSALAFYLNSPALKLIAAVTVLMEVGHIVRTVEQWNDSIEGALMLETYSKPLFKDQKL